jgi:HSP20 family protein
MKNTRQQIFMPNLSTVLDDIFGTETIDTIKRNLTPTLPSANILETEKAHIIELAVPGMEKTDFKVDLAENKLSISATKEKSTTENSENKNSLKVVRKEFSYSEFKRTFTLPKNSNTENIAADYTNGILKITIPKKEEQEKKNTSISVK